MDFVFIATNIPPLGTLLYIVSRQKKKRQNPKLTPPEFVQFTMLSQELYEVSSADFNLHSMPMPLRQVDGKMSIRLTVSMIGVFFYQPGIRSLKNG